MACALVRSLPLLLEELPEELAEEDLALPLVLTVVTRPVLRPADPVAAGFSTTVVDRTCAFATGATASWLSMTTGDVEDAEASRLSKPSETDEALAGEMKNEDEGRRGAEFRDEDTEQEPLWR